MRRPRKREREKKKEQEKEEEEQKVTLQEDLWIICSQVLVTKTVREKKNYDDDDDDNNARNERHLQPFYIPYTVITSRYRKKTN